MKKTTVISVLLSALIFSHTMFAQEPPGESGPGKGRKALAFERISKTVSGIKTISGSFRQERRLSMLKEPVVSSGRFYCEKPDKLRWEITNPDPSGFLVNGASAKQWKGNEGPSDAFDARQNPVIRLIVDQIFAWTSADLKWIEQRYSVNVLKDGPIALRLVPRDQKERRYVDHIRILFEEGTNYVQLVDIVEKSGDSTSIAFSNMVMNGQLQKGLFD